MSIASGLPVTPSPRWTRRELTILLLIIATGFGLRFHPAVSSIPHHDEFKWMRIVDTIHVSPTAIHIPNHGDQHPPGHAYWSWLGTRILGKNLLGYRLASVLLGTMAILLIAELGRRGAGGTAGLIAALLLAVNEYHIAASSLCTEKTHLTFALAALLAFRATIDSPTIRNHVFLGAALGLGLLTKQTVALWVPVVALLLLRWTGGRERLKTPGIWWALLAMLVLASPDLIYNLGSGETQIDPGARGLGFQADRIRVGDWSWGPFALFVRPLFYHRVEGALSEYPAMTTIPGLVVILAALASWATCRDRWNRFLVLLGFGTLLFFAVATTPRGEFWWADLALLPLILSAAAALARIRGRARTLVHVGLLALLIPAVRVATDAEHQNPLDWGRPPQKVAERFRNGMRSVSLQHSDRDMVALLSWAGGAFPAREYHLEWLREYRDILSDRARFRKLRGIRRVPRREREVRLLWVESEIARFEERESRPR